MQKEIWTLQRHPRSLLLAHLPCLMLTVSLPEKGRPSTLPGLCRVAWEMGPEMEARVQEVAWRVLSGTTPLRAARWGKGQFELLCSCNRGLS